MRGSTLGPARGRGCRAVTDVNHTLRFHPGFPVAVPWLESLPTPWGSGAYRSRVLHDRPHAASQCAFLPQVRRIRILT